MRVDKSIYSLLPKSITRHDLIAMEVYTEKLILLTIVSSPLSESF